jgi:acetyl esterase
VGAAVVSVAYRLAPANRFPAAVEDAYASAAWFAGHGDELGADGRRLAVMGDSAGGNLAAVVCLAARDRGGPAIRHQTLVYPCTDLTLASPSMASNAHAPLLTADEVRVYVDHYLGPGADRSHPYASPLLAADHSGLPPALVQVAEHDPIRDDGRRYAEALRDAGVPVRLTEYVGMPHGYITLPGLCRSAGQALAEICQELSGHLA